eukprot:2995481-Amphidinium_carterae.1
MEAAELDDEDAELEVLARHVCSAQPTARFPLNNIGRRLLLSYRREFFIKVAAFVEGGALHVSA